MAITPVENQPVDRKVLYFALVWPFAILLIFLPSYSLFSYGDNPLNGNARGGDYLIFWFAGVETLAGRVAELYDAALLKSNIIEKIDAKYQSATWLYPPHILFIYAGLGKLSYGLGWLIFTGLTAAAFLYTVIRRFSVNPKMILLCAVSPAAFICLIQGQTGFLVSALLLGALFALPTRPVLAGILIGCLTVKPQIGLLIPFILIFERQYVTFAVAAITTILLVAASALWLGTDIWLHYFTGLFEGGASDLLQTIRTRTVGSMMTVYGFANSIGLGHGLAMALQGLVAVLCIAAAYLVARSNIDATSRAMTYVLLCYLVSPYVMSYDFPAVSVAAAMVICGLGGQSYFAPERWLAYGVFALPLIHYGSEYVFVPVSVFILGGFTAMMVLRCLNVSGQGMRARVAKFRNAGLI